jgi:hypothetical protein
MSSDRELRLSVVILTFVAALGLFTKFSLLYTFPLGLVAIVLRQLGRSPNWVLKSIGYCVMFIGVALAIALLGALLIPGSIDRVSWAHTTLPPKIKYVSLDYLIALWPLTVESFWGRFGWMNVRTATWLAPALSVLAAVGLSSSAFVVARSQSLDKASRTSLVLMFCNCFLVLLAFLYYNFADTQPQGRYLYPGIAAFSLLVSAGLLRLSPKYRIIIGTALVLTIFCFNLISLFSYLLPAYYERMP